MICRISINWNQAFALAKHQRNFIDLVTCGLLQQKLKLKALYCLLHSKISILSAKTLCLFLLERPQLEANLLLSGFLFCISLNRHRMKSTLKRCFFVMDWSRWRLGMRTLTLCYKESKLITSVKLCHISTSPWSLLVRKITSLGRKPSTKFRL